MGTPWSAKLSTVKVARSETPKPVTIILPFYQNGDFLKRQVDHWRQFPPEITAHLSAIIVDDGSPEPASAVLTGVAPPFPLRLFRIDVDVRWNWLAARNLGAHHADEGWLLLTDMDHMIPATTAYAAIYGQHDPTRIYGFARYESTGQRLTPHPNSWFMTRAMFWKAGGYDETFSGFYGTDGEIRRRFAATAPMQILAEHLVRHEFDGDSSTRKYLRKQPEDAAVKRLIAQRGKDWRPKVLSFPAHEVAL